MPVGGLEVLTEAPARISGAAVLVLEAMNVVSEAPDVVVNAIPVVEFRAFSATLTVV